MSRKSNHVVPSAKSGGWAIKKYGSATLYKSFSTKEKAIAYARKLSRDEKTELFIHRKDGTVQNRSVFGNDSFAAKASHQ